MYIMKALELIMKSRKIKKSDIAKAINKNPSSLRTIMGKDEVTVSNAVRIAEAIGCEIQLLDKETGQTIKIDPVNKEC